MSELTTHQPSDVFVKQATVSGMAAYQALCKKAETDYEGFWAEQARRLISWKTPFTKILNQSDAPFFKWFEDGTLNASYNCLDRNIEKGHGNKTALIFEADKLSDSELNEIKSLCTAEGAVEVKDKTFAEGE